MCMSGKNVNFLKVVDEHRVYFENMKPLKSSHLARKIKTVIPSFPRSQATLFSLTPDDMLEVDGSFLQRLQEKQTSFD